MNGYHKQVKVKSARQSDMVKINFKNLIPKKNKEM